MGFLDYFLKPAPDAAAIKKKEEECAKCSADLTEMRKNVVPVPTTSTGATIGGKSRRNRRNSRKHKRRKSRRRRTA